MHYQVKITCPEDIQDTLIADLLRLDFESFWQDQNQVLAYIDKEKFDEITLKDIIEKHLDSTENAFEVSDLEEKNWNEEWEKNFEPVFIEDQIAIKADFHILSKSYPYEITVNPKMSFGTGHHETTDLMLKTQLNTDFQGKSILDVGTGTGILAIMAQKLGARDVVATDIDDWSIENSRENFLNNECQEIEILQGSIEELAIDREFDIILANINRNVLLHEIPFYSGLLKQGGVLLLSGFYDTDIVPITVACERSGLNAKNCALKNKWACLTFQK